MRLERPSLLQICLSLEPSFPAYHAAWEFALATNPGDLADLARRWELALPNKEALRQLTLADTPPLSPGYLRDSERFSRPNSPAVIFSTCAAAIRGSDPHHLVLGCRFGGPPGSAVVAECIHPHVDVLSASDPHDTLAEQLDAYWRANSMPILVGAFSWTGDYFYAAQVASRASQRGPHQPFRQAHAREGPRRARGSSETSRRSWATRTAPLGGPSPDDLPPFGRGLVHVDDREAREHSRLLSDINARAEALRRATAAPPVSLAP